MGVQQSFTVLSWPAHATAMSGHLFVRILKWTVRPYVLRCDLGCCCRKHLVDLLQLSPEQATQLRVAFEQCVRVKLNLIEQHHDAAAVMTAATDRKPQQIPAREARIAALQEKQVSAAEQGWPGLASVCGSSNVNSLDPADLDLDLDVDFDLGSLEFDQGFDQEMLQLSHGDASAAAAAAAASGGNSGSLQEGSSHSTEQMQHALLASNMQQQVQLQPDTAAAVQGELFLALQRPLQETSSSKELSQQ
jgi:hypothetical protein